MKKIKLVLKTALFCLAAALTMGVAQAGTGTTNLLNNWSFELPGTGKISTGFDTIPYWFSDATATDSGVENGEVPPDGSTWNAYMKGSDTYCRANQTTTHLIQNGECYIASIWCKNEWVYTSNYAHTNGYLTVVLYYGGTPDIVVGNGNATLGTVGTPFFTNTFVILPGSASHLIETDWTNYVFGVITDAIPAAAIGQPIGIQFWNSSTQYNASVDGTKTWMEEDDVHLYATNGISPISTPVALTPTNSVWGGDTLTFTENAFGSTPLVYQWQTDGGSGGALTNILGANANIWWWRPRRLAGTYKYQVIITNNYGSCTSAVVSYVVRGLAAPAITQDTGTADWGPITNLFAFIGGNVNLYSTSDGAPIITNQWSINTGGGYVAIAGATNYLRVLTNVQSSSVGYYRLGATNAYGRSNSTPAHLTTLADPAAPSGNGSTNMYSYCVYTNHPWAYWKLEETTNTLNNSMQAYDYSGHNFDATYGNSDGTTGSGCLDNQPGPNTSTYYPGFPDNNLCAATAYNHDNGYLTVPPLNLNTNTVTFTMWISPNSSVIMPSTGLFMNRNGGDAAGIGFGSNVQTNGSGENMAELGYTWNNDSAATYGWHSGLYPPGGIWSFVACTITPSNATMYLYYVSSGNQGLVTNLFKAVNPVANTPESFSGGTTWIGGDNWSNGRNFDGEIDEVAVFTNALTEAQIQNLFLRSLGLTTGIPPVFTAQPTNALIFQNQPLTMTATASGVPAPWYQWQYESGTAWASMGTAVGRTPNASTLVYPNWISTTITNFRCIATNLYGSATSGVAVATMTPIVNYNKGLWTVNFSAATTAQQGPGIPYVGYGLLGTNTYWNALGGIQLKNATSLRDDGSTYSGVMFGTTNAYVGTYSSGISTTNFDNLLLDQYAQIFDTNYGMNFFFTQVPKGRYNVALYGCTAVWANRGVIFTVYTNGVSAGTQSVTNKQDTLFVPYDNAVVYTNLIVESGMLQVNASIVPVTPANNPSTEADFNGAQLELITWGPNVLSLTNSGTNLVLTYAGGNVLSSTNILGPWITNAGSSGVGAYTFAPTGQMRFFKVYTNVQH